MRTSAKVVLAVSIVLLVLGTALVFLSVSGAFRTPQPQVYRYSAPGISYSYSYYSSSCHSLTRASALLESFGKLAFASGLAGLFIFTYLACHPIAKNSVDESVKAEEKTEEKTAETAEKKEIPTVIELGDNTKPDNEQSDN